ncbi:COP9 signalosome catalytic subunit rri1 [Naganishia albida]|nr:COP9 signalosome catalytic subunit rri1 [Naganishia albida]
MEVAQKTFELNNNIETIDANDEIFRYNRDEQMELVKAESWTKDPHYFQSVKISAVALIKMVIHARSGGQYEIMGLMNGKIQDRTFYIMDTFALPVQGTETRVNAGNEAMEYMVNYNEGNSRVQKNEMVVGWYHSHPGYGCWLSGIDVNTQLTNQKFSDPYLAVVIDPNRTISAGKVEIGAFRCYPEGYTPPNASASEYQPIPLDKVEDFGVHANSYYQLDVSIFKSSLDTQLLSSLWNKYWVNTLGQSPLISSRSYAISQLNDLSAKLGQVQASAKVRSADSTSVSKKAGENGKPGTWEEKDSALKKAAKDGARISAESQHGLIAQVLKDRLFNTDLKAQPPMDPPAALMQQPDA